jgi:hypothetical protein
VVQLSGRLAIRYEPLISQVSQAVSPAGSHAAPTAPAALHRKQRRVPAPHPPHPHFGRRTAMRFWSGFHPQARSQSTRVQSPIVAAVSCFFVNDPTIDFDLTGLLNVGDMPVLSGIIRKVLR